MAPIAQRVRGTQDLLPREQPVWDAMQAAATQQAERFGYQRVETPIFEATELFVRAAGEASDIVTHEMYTFRDRGNRSLTLRPEGTAPIVRAYFEGGLDQEPQPVRLYYLGPYFRYDRPQAGRMRELHQFGIEAIGDASPMLDVEAILIAWAWFGALGITGVTLRLNSIGDEVCRPAYRDRLRDYYRPHLDRLSADSRVRFEKNPLRLFDSKDPEEEALKREAPKIVDHLCPACAEAFTSVKAILTSEKVPFHLDPLLVRGLDYYTRTVFEFQHEALGGAQNALCGGGRYDGLAAALGYRSTPGIGFAAGLDRTAMVLKDSAPQAPPGPDVYAVALETGDEAYVLHLAGTLRGQGLRVVVDPGGGRLDAKLRKAARRGARVTVLVGPTEREKAEAVVRDMRQKTQVSVPVQELIPTVNRALTGS
jgi:histidyl-tRNA synthetase